MDFNILLFFSESSHFVSPGKASQQFNQALNEFLVESEIVYRGGRGPAMSFYDFRFVHTDNMYKYIYVNDFFKKSQPE